VLAISNDRFTDPTVPTACKSYQDVVAKLQELADRAKDPVHIRQDVVWVVDQIRMRYRLDPIGLTGGKLAPQVVLGTGYVPQAMVWYGARNTTKGKSVEQFNLHSLNIEVSKGTEHVMRSGDAKTFARRLKADMFKLVSRDNLYIPDRIARDIGSVPKSDPYIPFIEESLRSEMYSYFASEDKVVTPGIAAWIKEKSELVNYTEKKRARQEYIRSLFYKRSVVIYKMPIVAEYKYFFVEATGKAKTFAVLTEPVFFSDINDLTERYPHVVGANNLLRMKNENIFDVSTGFNSDFNFIRETNSQEIFADAHTRIAIFPAERIPSEDEMLGAQAVEAVKPIAEESALSVLNF
jgi:hypothetical protein